MDEQRKQLKELLILKSKLETAAQNNNVDEVRKCLAEFKAVYEACTGKKFEEEIPENKLKNIRALLNGEEFSEIDDEKDYEEPLI